MTTYLAFTCSTKREYLEPVSGERLVEVVMDGCEIPPLPMSQITFHGTRDYCAKFEVGKSYSIKIDYLFWKTHGDVA